MELTEVIYGSSSLQNPLKAYCSTNFYNDKYLYFVAGIHGDSIEGINIVNHFLTKLKQSEKTTFPCVLIPILDVDGYLYQQTGLFKDRNLNNLFPTSSFRKLNSSLKETPTKILPPEIQSLTKLLLDYPPQLFINLRTAKNSAKIIGIGEEAQSVASFLSKSTNYPLVNDNSPTAKTLEAFIYDFFLCPVVTVRLPFFTEKKTVSDIFEENQKGFEQLFSGQVY
jgi:protein MpaA